jgi:UDP-N-acetylglucosamine 2-epimerase (non-hydrolysing)
MIQVLCIIGTRPEAIKMAPVVLALQRQKLSVTPMVCVTGQHRDMVQPILGLFEIESTMNLAVMTSGQTLASLTSRLITALDKVLKQTTPDWIIAQGDTTSVFVASLLSFYHGIRFAHVEAGLRTGDLNNPFPEEFNRRSADLLAEVCFAPTQTARTALLREGIARDKIEVTGNTIVDALHMILKRNSAEAASSDNDPGRKTVMITLHRRESFGRRIRETLSTIRRLALDTIEHDVFYIFPVHPNPNVRLYASQMLSDIPNLSLVDPMPYWQFLRVLTMCSLVITDSGGVQEEAPSLGIPVLLVRDVTERPEGVEMGLVRIVGTDNQLLYDLAKEHVCSGVGSKREHKRHSPYGDGKAAERIVKSIVQRS